MANPLLAPADRCSGQRISGAPCGAPRLHGSVFCFVHDPERAESIRRGSRTELVTSVRLDLSLDQLAHLDPNDPASLQRLCVGLAQHVAAGSIGHREALAIVKLREAAAAAAPVSRDARTDGMLARVLAQAPPPEE
jgi:hypothetical protein